MNSTWKKKEKELKVKVVFTSNIEIPEGLDENELSVFYESNKEKIIGNITYKIMMTKFIHQTLLMVLK